MRLLSVNRLMENVTIEVGRQEIDLSYAAIEHLYREVQKAKKEGKPREWTMDDVRKFHNGW